MKRSYSMLVGILSVILLLVYVGVSEAKAYGEKEVEPPKGEFFLTYEEVIIRPWESEHKVCFFLPSYFEWEKAELVALNGELTVDGKKIVPSEDPISYDMEKEYSYHFSWGDVESSGTLQFLQSANVGTVYLETESGSMEGVDQDKEYREGGLILVKDAQGNSSYSGFLEFVKSRGNSTWKAEKKSYSIKLAKEAELLGMEESRNWILLCNVFDGNKLQNKLCLEMARDIGLAYTVESEWVDLYLNGQYWGNYLLCERVEVGENKVAVEDLEEETMALNGDMEELELFDTGTQKGVLAEKNPEDIRGGYIIEKDYFYDSISGFETEDGNPFSFKSPQYATQEQVEYMADYVQQIEDMILSDDERLFDYIDVDSFVLRYLVDEAVLNSDFGVTSMFFYKDREDERLYAGPIWDYDGCMGASDFTNSKVLAALDIQQYRREGSLTWYPYLYENETFYKEIVESYQNIVKPYILDMIKTGGKIDTYAERIRDSVKMDMVRWSYTDYGAGHYESFDNNVRYVKYFMARRLRFLDQEWLEEDNHYEPEGTGELHTVTFIGKESAERVEVPDGEVIVETPEHLLGDQEWWYTKRNQEPFYPDIPVYEDVTYQSGTGM